MEVLRPCWAVATSGVPVREQLFNASICHHTPFNLFQHGDFSRSFGRHVDVSSLEVATPILIARDDGHKHRKGSHGDVIFLTNRGEVLSYLNILALGNKPNCWSLADHFSHSMVSRLLALGFVCYQTWNNSLLKTHRLEKHKIQTMT